ncbi:MAG: class I SAM-dependent methyltransferase, partial [Bacillati bacterium]
YSIAVDVIPRNIFPNLSKPLCFGLFTKNADRRIVGLAFYDETADVLSMACHDLLNTSSSPWRTLVRDRLSRMGGTATLQQLYRAIEPGRPSGNPWWKEKIRQMVQTDTTISRVAPATYALAT